MRFALSNESLGGGLLLNSLNKTPNDLFHSPIRVSKNFLATVFIEPTRAMIPVLACSFAPSRRDTPPDEIHGEGYGRCAACECREVQEHRGVGALGG